VPGRNVVPLKRGGPHGPTLAELSARASRLQEQSHTGSLRSLHTVLLSLILSADEALDQVEDESNAPFRAAALGQSLGAVGAYLVHACELTKMQLGELISAQYEKEELELPKRAGSIR